MSIDKKHIKICLYKCTSKNKFIHFILINLDKCTYTHIFLCIYQPVYISIHNYVYIYLYLYTYIIIYLKAFRLVKNLYILYLYIIILKPRDKIG